MAEYRIVWEPSRHVQVAGLVDVIGVYKETDWGETPRGALELSARVGSAAAVANASNIVYLEDVVAV